MAFPRKNSRTIVVGDRTFRWHLFISEDEPGIREVFILADDNPNGSRLGTSSDTASVTPAMIRRVIEVGLADGWDPDSGVIESHMLSAEQAAECFQFFRRELEWMGGSYLWHIAQKGGLHFRIRSATAPKGQLLATLGDIEPRHTDEKIAGAIISKAIELGWKSEQKGLDCFWIDADICSGILSEFESK